MPPCSHFLSSVRPLPSSSLSFHRSECTQCFVTDIDEGGINVCLTCWNGGCTREENHARKHNQITGHSVSLNIVKRIDESKVAQESSQPTKLTKLSIPSTIDSVSFVYSTSFYCFACQSSFDVDESTRSLVDSIIAHQSSSLPTVQEGMGWEDSPAAPCVHTKQLEQSMNLPQINTRSPAVCSQCSVNDRLWLCLTCGSIGCSRRQYGDDQSGNGHGIAHYEAYKHPLVLKLGTIKHDGTADIHCYACNETVTDESLAAHLSGFGINILHENAQEKSTAELQLESNLKWKWSRTFDEEGKEMEALYGNGYCGLENLGNSCYLASVVQVLFALPEFKQRFYHEGSQHSNTCNSRIPADCFLCQMFKLANALHSAKYSKQPEKEQKMADENSEEENSKKRKQMVRKLIKVHLFDQFHSFSL
jgi:ubiquitin carboxyl-terminal hydrolase 5/13